MRVGLDNSLRLTLRELLLLLLNMLLYLLLWRDLEGLRAGLYVEIVDVVIVDDVGHVGPRLRRLCDEVLCMRQLILVLLSGLRR